MNKIFLTLGVLAVVLVVATGNDEWKAKMKANKEECKASTNYKGGEGKKDGEESKEYKCFLNCFGEKMGMVKDGKLQVEKLQEMVEKKLGNSNKLEENKQGIKKCNEQVNESDKCEAALKYKKCLKKEAPEFMDHSKKKE